jgi:hypothetical protein
MTFQRLLAIVVAFVLVTRLWPLVAPWIWPRLKPRMARLQRRADLATAAVMIVLVVSALVRGEQTYAALIAVLSIPALVAGIRALRS